MVRFLIATAASPASVASALRDAYAIESTSDLVPRRDTGELVTVTRFVLSYPLLLVTGRAVPSVGGSNLHVKVQSGWLMKMVDALAVCGFVVYPIVTLVVLIVSIGWIRMRGRMLHHRFQSTLFSTSPRTIAS